MINAWGVFPTWSSGSLSDTANRFLSFLMSRFMKIYTTSCFMKVYTTSFALFFKICGTVLLICLEYWLFIWYVVPPSRSLQLFSATVVTFYRCKEKWSSGPTSLDIIILIFYSVTPVLNEKIEFCWSVSFKRHPVWIRRHE